MSYQDKEADNRNDIVNLFKSYFSNTYNLNTENLPHIKYYENTLYRPYIDIEKYIYLMNYGILN